MQFTISSKTLEGHLSLLIKEVASKCSTPVMGMMEISLSKNVVTMTTANEDKSYLSVLSKVTDQGGEEEGKVYVNPTALLNAIRGIDEQNIFVDAKDGKLSVTYKGGLVCIKYDTKQKFPECKSLSAESSAVNKLSGKMFTDGIKRCIYATTNDLVRPITTSVYVEINADNLQMTGIDGRRIVVSKYAVKDATPCTLILPKRIARILQGINEDKMSMLVAQEGADTRFEMQIGGYIRLGGVGVKGDYPDYKNVIKKSTCNVKAEVNRADLVSALGRASYFVPASGKALFKFSKSELSIQGAEEENGYNVTQTIPMTCESENEISKSLSCTFLAEMLRSLDGEKVAMRLSVEPERPLLVSQNDDNCKVIALLMPMKQ